MVKQTVRTTVTLPEQLLEAVDLAVMEGKAKSRNELIASALGHELAALKRREIDEAFTGMAGDENYRNEAREISEEFNLSDWEALRQNENPK
ncbi:MAG: ribbon-helix-helix domain-containing protein [Chloroflexi bacterium]|nr:ribbon-helix-helix domain-containing protein [Chloroflexota bacterium]MDA1219107.1 ribbon-helix-helix domain-containing protein [Chloroflexota bacterium]